MICVYVPVLRCDSRHSIYRSRRLRSTFEFIRLLQPTSTRDRLIHRSFANSTLNSSISLGFFLYLSLFISPTVCLTSPTEKKPDCHSIRPEYWVVRLFAANKTYIAVCLRLLKTPNHFQINESSHSTLSNWMCAHYTFFSAVVHLKRWITSLFHFDTRKSWFQIHFDLDGIFDGPHKKKNEVSKIIILNEMTNPQL